MGQGGDQEDVAVDATQGHNPVGFFWCRGEGNLALGFRVWEFRALQLPLPDLSSLDLLVRLAVLYHPQAYLAASSKCSAAAVAVVEVNYVAFILLLGTVTIINWFCYCCYYFLIRRSSSSRRRRRRRGVKLVQKPSHEYSYQCKYLYYWQ